MTTATQEAPPQAVTPAPRTLVSFRGKKKQGLPKSGIFVINGYPKTGKTSFMASFPDSYIINLDTQDADYVDGRIEDIHDVVETVDGQLVVKSTKLNEFRAALSAAIKDPAIKVIGIDTLDTLSELLATEIANLNGLEKITDRSPGVDGFQMWSDFAKKIEAMLGAFKRSGKLILLAAHKKEPKLDDNNKVITPAGINVSGKGGDKILFAADIIGEMVKNEVGGQTAYCLSFQGGISARCGSRVEELADKVIRLDRKNPYSSFAALFDVKAAEEKAAVKTTTKKSQGGK